MTKYMPSIIEIIEEYDDAIHEHLKRRNFERAYKLNEEMMRLYPR